MIRRYNLDLSETPNLTRGEKSYELSNHLGNVLEVITDQKFAISDVGSGIDHFLAEVISYTDYYPFGAPMDNGSASSDRNWQGDYRYGVNGKENTFEIDAEFLLAKYWGYDSKLARSIELDPIPQYALSDYSVLGNNPIRYIDPLGNRWEPSADNANENKAADLDRQLGSRQKSLQKEADKLFKRYSKLEAKGKEEKADKMWYRFEEVDRGAQEMKKARNELAEMGSHPTLTFTFQQTTAQIGYAYMNSSGSIVIEYNTDQNAIHELVHAYQHISGAVEHTPVPNSSIPGTYYVDVYDETDAYKRQYYFQGASAFNSSIYAENHSGRIEISKSTELNSDWLFSIYPASYTISNVNGTEIKHYTKTSDTPLYENLRSSIWPVSKPKSK